MELLKTFSSLTCRSLESMESVCVFCTPILCDFRQFNWSAMLASVILFRCCSVLSWRHFLSGSTADQDQYQGTASQILGWICSVMYPLFMKVQKLLCTCSRKYVKETCTYLYQPLKQNSATEFFFLILLGCQCFGAVLGPPVLWQPKLQLWDDHLA